MSVRTTDFLCWRWWFESKFKYWSVCVGFRYTVRPKESSSLRVVHESRKGACLPFPIQWCTLCSHYCCWGVPWTCWQNTHGSSRRCHQHISAIVRGCANGLGLKLLHVQVGYDRGHWRTHGHSMFLFIDVAFVREVRGIQVERQHFNDAFAGEGGCVRVIIDRCSICLQWQRWRQA